MASEEGQVIVCKSVSEFKDLVQKSIELGKLVVVDFTATWCPPCRFIAPIFVEMAKPKPHVIFVKVDVDDLSEVAKEWSVEAMPTFLFLKEGKEVHRIVGADKDALQTAVNQHGALTA